MPSEFDRLTAAAGEERIKFIRKPEESSVLTGRVSSGWECGKACRIS